MGEQPILTFDTSAINQLAGDADSDALLQGVTSGFFVHVTFDSLEEIAATTRGEMRHKLLGVCTKLLAAGDCIDLAGPILEKMAAEFEVCQPFDWTRVDVSLPETAGKISRTEDFTNDLARQVREEKRENERRFGEVYSAAKPHFERVFASEPDGAPRSPAELVARLPETVWKAAGNIYTRYGKKPPDEATVRRFVKECDPFRALMIAFFAAAYDRCARPCGSAGSFRSGWGDTLMAVCLPYCNQFVTHDTGQLRFYKEVVSLAGLQPITVRSYAEFRGALCLG